MDKILNTIDPYLNLYILSAIILAAILLGGWGLYGLLRSKPKPVYTPEIKRNWLATGRIDVTADDAVMASDQDDVPAAFVLLVQDQRLIADIGGAPLEETRWRMATKREVKRIVSRYHNMCYEPHISGKELQRSAFESGNIFDTSTLAHTKRGSDGVDVERRDADAHARVDGSHLS